MSGENPILAPKNSKLLLNQDGFLILISSNGSQLWSPDHPHDANVATLLDSGNFIICQFNCNATSPPIWQSFLNLTDTIVPGQNLSNGQQLWSRLTDSNFSQGRFTLFIESTDGSLALYPVNPFLSTKDKYPAIWAIFGTPNCTQLAFNSNGSLYCPPNPQLTVIPFVSLSPHDYYLHATLDPDGLFRIYAYPKRTNAVEWQVIGINIADGCNMWSSNSHGVGVCGVNGLCNTSSRNQTRLECKCPPNFSYLDPDNIYLGCKSDLEAQQYLSDAPEATEFEFTDLWNTDWKNEDYEWFKYMDEVQCKENCLKDYSCAVAQYDAYGCYKKSLPLRFGISGTDVDKKTFIKVRKSNPKNIGRKLFLVGSAILLGIACILLIVVVLLVAHLRHTYKKSPMDMSRPNLKEFTYKELVCATKNFEEELGRGSFGVVYKGLLPSDPPTAIAVKKLQLLNDGEREFQSEVHSIGQIRHNNLVKLIGFCDEGSNRMLIYEYMSKGSLSNFIRVGDERLDWDQTVNDIWTDKMNEVLEQLKEQLVNDMGNAGDKATIQIMQKFVEVAVACLQVDPSVRPTMRDVAYLLACAIPVPAPTSTNTISTPGTSNSMATPGQRMTLYIDQSSQRDINTH
ncbi:Serine/threonine-protein kinase [Rhynchospora pubera]|uniref:non-specific serine/threonine protein kinase n=1 Tax=Rhynchospora pubera TaxID=906938 RepID=A0AAV8D340_9POAL|nr:Serine/threonine-protein kinase [Rhynchospora pubera]